MRRRFFLISTSRDRVKIDRDVETESRSQEHIHGSLRITFMYFVLLSYRTIQQCTVYIFYLWTVPNCNNALEQLDNSCLLNA